MPGWIVVAKIPAGLGDVTTEYYAAWIEDPAQAIELVERDFDPEHGVAVTCEDPLTDDELRKLGATHGGAEWISKPKPSPTLEA